MVKRVELGMCCTGDMVEGQKTESTMGQICGGVLGLESHSHIGYGEGGAGGGAGWVWQDAGDGGVVVWAWSSSGARRASRGRRW